MKYYVTADIHGFFDEFKIALEEAGFFTDTEPHKLIICGDLFDRGKQALELENFIIDLIEKDKIILIKGNHEDLALELLNEWQNKSYLYFHHHSNKTIDTICQLTNSSLEDMKEKPEEIRNKFLATPYIRKIIPSMHDYYETSKYIFVHGWIPCTTINFTRQVTEYVYMKDWRKSNKKDWDKARWINGMAAAHRGVTENGKTIVCGHWHSSFGHANYEGKGGEFDNDTDFSPYFGNGIIALDACTVFSGKVNCIVIND